MAAVKIFVLLALLAIANASFLNKEVHRSIDLTTHTPRHTLKIAIANGGKSSTDGYLLAFPASASAHLAWIEAADEEGNEIKVSPVSPADAKKDVIYYRAEIGGLPADGQKSITVSYVLTHALSPLPRKISQSDTQQMVYEDNHFFFSPYSTEAQKTDVKLSSQVVESRSEEKPTSFRGDTITYGPYENKPAFSHSALRVHFENNSPFFAATSLLKEIELSFWGNVAVEEHYDIRHTGAELKGYFSRLDLQRNPANNAISSIRKFKADLPVGAQDVYYRDVIGNISTSHLRDSEEGPEFEIIPRFPLFGGWKTQFYFGYNLPLPQYLSVDNNGRYHLNITYGSPIEEIVVDDHTVKIILPEGSSNFAVTAPFNAGEQTIEARFTYLDRVGRPVIVLHKKNVVSDHDVFFQVSFDFAGVYIWHEPLLLIIGFFAIFAVCIVRAHFFDSSDKSQDSISEFRALHAQRADLRVQIDKLHSRLVKGDVDNAAYREQYNALHAKLSSLAGSAKVVESSAEGAAAAEIKVLLKDEAALDESRHKAFSGASSERPVDEQTIARLHAKAESIDRSVHRH